MFDKLACWIRKYNGFVSSSLKVVTSTIDDITSRSIYTVKNIDKNRSLIRVPKKCKIHPDLVYDIPNIDKWIEQDDKNLIQNQLYYRIVISLIYQKSLGKNSFYYPYIRTLPKSSDLKNHIIFNGTAENLSDWKKCSLSFGNAVEKTLTSFNNLLEFITKCNTAYPIIDLEKFGNANNVLENLVKWAYVIFITRGWYKHGCVPFMDLFNHQCSSLMIAKYVDNCDMSSAMSRDRMNGSELVSYKNYEIGEEIYINYGKYDSKQLLRCYGFRPDDEIQYMELSVDYNPKLPIQHYIQQELNRFKFPKEKLLLTTRTPTSLLLKYLRIISLDYYDIPRTYNVQNYFDKMISNNNELNVYKTLLKLISNLRNTDYSTEYFNNCNMILETTDNFITKNLAQIVIDEYAIIKTNMLWIHGNWLAKLETPLLQDILASLVSLEIV